MTWRRQTFSLLKRDLPARQPETLGFLKEENLRRAVSSLSRACHTSWLWSDEPPEIGT